MNTNAMKKLLLLTITLILGIGDIRVSYASAPGAPGAAAAPGARKSSDDSDSDDDQKVAAEETVEGINLEPLSLESTKSAVDQLNKKLQLKKNEVVAPCFNTRFTGSGFTGLRPSYEYKGPMHITNISDKPVYIRFYVQGNPFHFWLPETMADVKNISSKVMNSLIPNMPLAKEITLKLLPNQMVFLRAPAIRQEGYMGYYFVGDISISTTPYGNDTDTLEQVTKTKPSTIVVPVTNETSEWLVIENNAAAGDSIAIKQGEDAKLILNSKNIRQFAKDTLTWRVNNYTPKMIFTAIYVPYLATSWQKVDSNLSNEVALPGDAASYSDRSKQISLTSNLANPFPPHAVLFFSTNPLKPIITMDYVEKNRTNIGYTELSLASWNSFYYEMDIKRNPNNETLIAYIDPKKIGSRGLGKLMLGTGKAVGAVGAATTAALGQGVLAGRDAIKNVAFSKPDPLIQVIDERDITAVFTQGALSFDPVANVQQTVSTYFTTQINESTKAWQNLSEKQANKEAAQAVSSDDLSKAEKEYLSERQKSRNFMYYAEDVPTRIALCSSGGGYRAMLSALGLYAGLENAGLYQKIDYNFGLSGGSWAALGVNQSGVEPNKYKQILFRGGTFLNNPLPFPPTELKAGMSDINSMMVETIRNNALYPKNEFTLVSPWGAAIAKRIFPNYDPRTDYIMGNKPKTDYPFVVTTAVTKKNEFNNSTAQAIGPWSPKDHYWLEFSHDQVSFVNLPDKSKARIPAMAFGRQFDDNGRSTDTPLPHTLAFGVGLYGSAICVSLSEANKMGMLGGVANLLANSDSAAAASDANAINLRKELAFNFVNNLARQASEFTYKQYNFHLFAQAADKDRVRPVKVSNWARNAAGDADQLMLADAGGAFNLPLPPALNPKRNIDVIIMNDGSSDIPEIGANELRKTLLYAKAEHGFTYELVQNQPAAAAAAAPKPINIYQKGTMNTQFLIDHLKNPKNNNMMVFKPIKPTGKNNQKAPLIIYFTVINPNTEKQIDFGAPKFGYTKEEANQLFTLMQGKVNGEAIQKVINDFMENRNLEEKEAADIQARPAEAEVHAEALALVAKELRTTADGLVAAIAAAKASGAAINQADEDAAAEMVAAAKEAEKKAKTARAHADLLILANKK